LLIFSFIGFVNPIVNHIFFIFLLTFIFLISLIKLEIAAYAILAELAIGGQGYLFSLTIAGFPISLRIGLFGVAFVSLTYHLLRKRKFPKIATTKFAIPFLLLSFFIVVGMFRGLTQNDNLLNLFDANAYVSILYVVIFAEAFYRKVTLTKAVTVLLSFSVALAITTIGLLGLYATSHYDTSLTSAIFITQDIREELSNQNSWEQEIVRQRIGPDERQFVYDSSVTTKTKPASYRWLRATGTAEISYISGRFFRVFSPSHILLLFSLFLALSLSWKKQSTKIQIFTLCGIFLMLASILISYSRSLWLGVFLGMLIFVFAWFKQTVYRQRSLIYALLLLVIFGFLFFFTGIGDTILNRVTSIAHPSTEVASTHRIELGKALLTQISHHPLFGTGFGTLVSFPTVLPNGEIIKASFYIYEWAYLDVAVKIGLIGLCSFLIVFTYTSVLLIKKYIQTNDQILFGFFSGFFACLVANVTTPIFTHPLGFGLLGFTIAYLLYTYESSNPARYLE